MFYKQIEATRRLARIRDRRTRWTASRSTSLWFYVLTNVEGTIDRSFEGKNNSSDVEIKSRKKILEQEELATHLIQIGRVYLANSNEMYLARRIQFTKFQHPEIWDFIRRGQEYADDREYSPERLILKILRINDEMKTNTERRRNASPMGGYARKQCRIRERNADREITADYYNWRVIPARSSNSFPSCPLCIHTFGIPLFSNNNTENMRINCGGK